MREAVTKVVVNRWSVCVQTLEKYAFLLKKGKKKKKKEKERITVNFIKTNFINYS